MENSIKTLELFQVVARTSNILNQTFTTIVKSADSPCIEIGFLIARKSRIDELRYLEEKPKYELQILRATDRSRTIRANSRLKTIASCIVALRADIF